MTQWRVAWVAKVLVAVVVWGASFVATKEALREVGPFTIITLRFGIGVTVLLGVLAARGEWRSVGRRETARFAVLGALGVVGQQMLQVNGLRVTTATNTAWMVTLTPVFTALLAGIFLHERLGPARVAGIAIVFAGALLVIGRGRLTSAIFGMPSTRGDLLAFLCAPNWAIFSVLSKPVLRRHTPALVMTWVLLLGWLMTLPFFVAGHGLQEVGRLGPHGWTAILFLGILCSGVAYIFWYDALHAADASRVVPFLYLEPLVTVAVAARLLGEHITLPTLAGGGVLLAGVWLASRPEVPQPGAVTDRSA